MNKNNILISRPEYQKSLFVKVVGKNGLNYYYNANPMSVWVDGDGQGMSGRTVTYEMLEGDTEVVKCPWNTNTDELLKQTGVDLTGNFYSYGVVLERKDVDGFMDGVDVEALFADEDWTKGPYDGAVGRMREKVLDMGLEHNNNLIIAFVNHNGTLNFASIK
jgi:hypothetical protein